MVGMETNVAVVNSAPEDLELLRLQVAERLGWRSIEYSREGRLIGIPPSKRLFHAVPSYARDIGAAWDLVEYWRGHGIQIRIQTVWRPALGRIYAVDIEDQLHPLAHAEAAAAPQAVCEAFLKVKGEQLSCLIANQIPLNQRPR